MRIIQIPAIMRRVPQSLLNVRKIQTVPARFRSSSSIADDTLEKPAGWENAKPYSEIAGPKPLPILGNFWRYMPFIGEFNNMKVPKFFDTVYEKYGPVAKLSGLGRPDIVILSDPAEFEKVLRHEGPWPLRLGSQSLEYYFKRLRTEYPISLTVSQGKEWQEFRTAVNQVMMQPRNTKQYVEPIDRVVHEFIERMREIRNDKLEMPPNFVEEVHKWALESITYVALDTRLNLLGKDVNEEADELIKCTHVVFESFYQLDFLPSPWKIVSTPAYRRFVKSMDFITQVTGKYVNLAMERLQNSPHAGLEERTYSVLENLLIRTNDPPRAITMALDMLLAGVDTTGAAVQAVMYQMAIHPEKQRKLQEELDRVIPDPNKALTQNQLEEMRYLRACVKEAMRVMPIIFANSRTTVKDMVLGGYQIPRGTTTISNGFIMQKNEKYFPRAQEFLPERWLNAEESLKSKYPFAYLPFGFGPRMCAGRRFADLEIEALISKVFRNFTLEWNRPPMEYNYHSVFHSVDPLTFTVKDRV